jgi:hypothetical protein
VFIQYEGESIEVTAAVAPEGEATHGISYVDEVGGAERTFKITRTAQKVGPGYVDSTLVEVV